MKAAIPPLAFVALAAAAAALLPTAPAQAQSGNTVIDVFGTDPCPTSNGEEIVVCRRYPDSERFRIPKDLRDAAKGKPPPNWAEKAIGLEYVGRSGTNSCSPVGPGGWTGCYSQLMRDAKAERKAKKADEPVLP